MKKTLNIILFGRKKSYFVKCTLTLIGLYLGVLFWYFNGKRKILLHYS